MSTFETLEGSRVKISMEIDSRSLEDAMQREYIKTAKDFNMPGFRKGKAPRRVIETTYGPFVFFDGAFDALYYSIYENAVIEHGIKPVESPKIEIESVRGMSADDDLPEGVGVRFSAIVAVYPEVALGDYKGIEVLKREYTVTDEMVDAEINRDRESMARFVEVDRPVENGDTVNLDYSGSVDGVKFDGGTAQNQELLIGSGRFIPGFEEQLVGMTEGQTQEITVTFPEEYHAKELAGREAVFEVKINDIRVKELPEADDEFAQDISDFETFADYRSDLRKKLEERAEERRRHEFESDAIQSAVDNAKLDLPDALIEDELNAMIDDLRHTMAQQGFTLDMFCEYTGKSIDQIRDEYRPDAEIRAKTRLVLDAIADKEGVEVTDEDINKAINDFLESMQSEQERKELDTDIMRSNMRAFFANRLKRDRTVSIIVDSATEKAE
ncbi:MAG: trigger factor [Candidatus Gastranaerophilaceae bacterium]|nr:trigger factor [Christensenellales bacterium]